MNEFKPDNLIANINVPIITDVVALKQGEKLKRGSVLGVDGDGKYLLSKSGATDGSNEAVRILAEDADATAKELKVVVFKMGAFNANSLILGDGHTVESVKKTLWEKSNIDIKIAIKG